MKESEAKERLRDLVKPGARWRPIDLMQAARDLLNAEPEDALPWKVHRASGLLMAGFPLGIAADAYVMSRDVPGDYSITGPDTPLPDAPGGQRVPYEAEDDPDGLWCVECGETTPGNGRCGNCDEDTPTPRLVEITGPIYRLEVGGD